MTTYRRLWELIASHSGQCEGRAGTLNELDIRPILNSLDLFPSRSQGIYAAVFARCIVEWKCAGVTGYTREPHAHSGLIW